MRNNLQQALALVVKELEDGIVSARDYDFRFDSADKLDLTYSLRRVQTCAARIARLASLARALEKLA